MVKIQKARKKNDAVIPSDPHAGDDGRTNLRGRLNSEKSCWDDLKEERDNRPFHGCREGTGTGHFFPQRDTVVYSRLGTPRSRGRFAAGGTQGPADMTTGNCLCKLCPK